MTARCVSCSATSTTSSRSMTPTVTRPATACSRRSLFVYKTNSEDTVGRLGGDEFAVICENGSASTEVLLDRVRDALATPYSVRGDLIAASVSIGIASPQQGESSTQMLERADSTMYQAKATRPVA